MINGSLSLPLFANHMADYQLISIPLFCSSTHGFAPNTLPNMRATQELTNPKVTNPEDLTPKILETLENPQYSMQPIPEIQSQVWH